MHRTLPAQVLPLLALLLVSLLAFAALGTDAAWLYSQRRLTQNAADAAALAGARELLKRTASDTQVFQVAASYAALNGDTCPVPADAVAIFRPDTVRVCLEREVPLFFLPVLGTETLWVGARDSPPHARTRRVRAPRPRRLDHRSGDLRQRYHRHHRSRSWPERPRGERAVQRCHRYAWYRHLHRR